MTFGHDTAYTAAFTRTLAAVAHQVAAGQRQMIAQLQAAHWPASSVRGAPAGTWRPDPKRVAADRRRRERTKRLHKQLRRAGRNKAGGRT